MKKPNDYILFIFGALFVLGEMSVAGMYSLRFAHLLWLLIPYSFFQGMRLSPTQILIILLGSVGVFGIPMISGDFGLSIKPLELILNVMLIPCAQYLFKRATNLDNFFKGSVVGGGLALVKGMMAFHFQLNFLWDLNFVASAASFRELLRFEYPLRPAFLLGLLLYLSYSRFKIKEHRYLLALWTLFFSVICAGALSRGIIIALVLTLIWFVIRYKILKDAPSDYFKIVIFATLVTVSFYIWSAKYFDWFMKTHTVVEHFRIEELGIKGTGSFTNPGGTVLHRINVWNELLGAADYKRWLVGTGGWKPLVVGSAWTSLGGLHNWFIEIIYRIGISGLLLIVFTTISVAPKNLKALPGFIILLSVFLFNDYFWLAPAWMVLIPPLPEK